MENRNKNGAQHEMDAFLPKDSIARLEDGQDTLKVTIRPASKKFIQGDSDGVSYFDPFKARNQPNATTDFETLTHLLKACLGTGILAMPYAFKNAGVVFGLIATLVVGIICTHCSYILVRCAHKLYYKTRVSSLTFPDVGEVAFANGPDWARVFSKPARVCIIVGIFLTYFGTCSAYTVIIAENLEQVIEHYTGMDLDKKWYIGALLIPLILLSWVPDLKSLAIFSLIANIFMSLTIFIALYYISLDVRSPWSLPKMADWKDLPEYFSITIFAMEAIGVMMPLENNMVTPQHFLGGCGVLNRGMAVVTMIYTFLGFFGYLRYGDRIEATISLNLDTTEIAPQCAKVFTGIAIFFTYGLQFYVCLEIVWNGIKDNFTKRQLFYNYVVRTFLVVLSIVVALAVPKISPFLGLVGALFFSALGIIFPVLIEFVVYWDQGFGVMKWRVWKNILILMFGILALVFGSYSSIKDIIKIYQPQSISNMNMTTPAFNLTAH